MNIYEATETSYKNGYRAGVKEFAERLKEEVADLAVDYMLVASCIDNLVKKFFWGGK